MQWVCGVCDVGVGVGVGGRGMKGCFQASCVGWCLMSEFPEAAKLHLSHVGVVYYCYKKVMRSKRIFGMVTGSTAV